MVRRLSFSTLMAATALQRVIFLASMIFLKSVRTSLRFFPRTRTLIVAYCGGPRCAYKRAAGAAEKLGHTNVKHLSAGISGWLKAGEKAEKAAKKKADWSLAKFLFYFETGALKWASVFL